MIEVMSVVPSRDKDDDVVRLTVGSHDSNEKLVVLSVQEEHQDLKVTVSISELVAALANAGNTAKAVLADIKKGGNS